MDLPAASARDLLLGRLDAEALISILSVDLSLFLLEIVSLDLDLVLLLGTFNLDQVSSLVSKTSS